MNPNRRDILKALLLAPVAAIVPGAAAAAPAVPVVNSCYCGIDLARGCDMQVATLIFTTEEGVKTVWKWNNAGQCWAPIAECDGTTIETSP